MTHIRLSLSCPAIKFRQHFFRFSFKELYICNTIFSGILTGILYRFGNHLHPVNLFCPEREKQRYRADTAVQIPYRLSSREFRIRKRRGVEPFRLRGINLIKGPGGNLIYDASVSFYKIISVRLQQMQPVPYLIPPPDRAGFFPHDNICILRVKIYGNTCHPGKQRKPVQEPVLLRNPFPLPSARSIDHNAHHQFLRKKTLPYQHMPHQPLPGPLIVSSHLVLPHMFQYGIQNPFIFPCP